MCGRKRRIFMAELKRINNINYMMPKINRLAIRDERKVCAKRLPRKGILARLHSFPAMNDTSFYIYLSG